MKPFAVFHEHPEWFAPLFAELDARGIPYEKLDASATILDINESLADKYSLFVNRMSPSSHLRGHQSGIFHTQSVLAHAEITGVPVVNGVKAYSYEINKSKQLSLLASLNLGYPASRAINDASLALKASEGLRFPVVVKANIGGSGAGIVRYNSKEELAGAVNTASIELGLDGTALVQEYVPARDGHITRVETVGGKFIYAIDIFSSGDSFNLCPADICQIGDQKPAIRIEATTPTDEVIKSVEQISAAAGLDVGGIELMIDDRDGKVLFYDINALSNFVGDWPRILGYNPHVQLVDHFLSLASR